MTRRIVLLLVAALAGLAFTAAPAVAKGGGGGGGGGNTAPVFVDTCVGYENLPNYADGDLATYAISTGGCTIIKLNQATGVMVVDFVVPQPGWTYDIVSRGGGTRFRIQVEFDQPTTGQSSFLRIEPGKTEST